MAVVFAICSAVCVSVTTVLQKVGVESAPSDSGFTLKLVLHVVRRPVWLAGLLMLIGGFIFHALALSRGQLSVVQPLLTTNLIFLLAILGFYYHQPVGLREWIGAVATSLGLGSFLYKASPQGGSKMPTLPQWGALGGVVLGLAFLSIVLARRGSPTRRTVLYGIAAAVSFALTASLIKTTTDLIRQGWSQVFLHWEPYGVVVVGVFAVLLLQNAYLAGPATVSQTTILIVDPFASIVVGVALFGDRLSSATGSIVIEAVALLVMLTGLWVLSNSPLISASAEESRVARLSGRERARRIS
jgi:drug/metabolite transporter (DMT)-like permease